MHIPSACIYYYYMIIIYYVYTYMICVICDVKLLNVYLYHIYINIFTPEITRITQIMKEFVPS